MTKILLIETATEVCSAAIAVNGTVVALAEDLHTVMRKVLKKTIERETGTVDVNFAQFAVKIGISVDDADLQPIRIFE